MQTPDSNIVPSNVVMETYIEPALEYYKHMLGKIAPYFFRESLVKMVALQQLIVSKNYKITRHDAREKKNVETIKQCVASILKPADLLRVMDAWRAFDLCLTAPSFVNPSLATNIRKSYCQVGQKSFDCHRCPKVTCKHNMIWNQSTIMLDFDTDVKDLVSDHHAIHAALDRLGLAFKIKLSSLGGLHVNVGLPEHDGGTIFDRNVYHYCLVKELLEAGVEVDDNALDPIPIIRAPYALHYKRLTPSLPVDTAPVEEAIGVLKEIEAEPLDKRIERATDVARSWKGSWEPGHSPSDAFEPLLQKWQEAAKTAIFRAQRPRDPARTNVGEFLRKGKLMTPDDALRAIELLVVEGKDRRLAEKIVGLQLVKEPDIKEPKAVDKEILLSKHEDAPRRVLEIPPPVLFVVIDNATIEEMRALTGASPIPLETTCTNTDEGMSLLFKNPGLLKRYGQAWQCKTVYIGGLYSAYHYCGAADVVIAVKMENVWDRDMKILQELERVILSNEDILVGTHLLGLDFCKDNGIDTSGAMHVFKKIVAALAGTRFSVVLTTDHSGSDKVPYVEFITKPRVED